MGLCHFPVGGGGWVSSDLPSDQNSSDGHDDRIFESGDMQKSKLSELVEGGGPERCRNKKQEG